eukprot:TRINITY_DN6226_c0_g2_i1.p1 TRINITY_DN6226_c0_g2~~TRINITY_DN6226_c0_g2_i1.p1  ORF type:complete len:512 (+),score=88.35 TRINITY_DN6226_c0_g2_i1:53-1537(+)
MPVVTEQPGLEYCLRDTLKKWGLSETYYKNMSERWRCKIVPTKESDDAAMQCLLEGNPCFLHKKYSEDIHKACGEDGIDYITKGKSNELQRPKLAFNSSWGKPGADLIHVDHLVPVQKFSEVFDHDSENPRNLQMFHRDTDEKTIPVLPSLIKWPTFLEEGSLKMDKATRLSQKDALTTWHLDDCGEFVLQTALKLRKERFSEKSLKGPNGKYVVKVFFCTPKASYDIITQDQEQNRSGVFAQLDLWNTPSSHLPDDLPVVQLCLVEAGGNPLILYPNLPHTVLTIENSCLVEERRVHISFLDEVTYFHTRSRQSITPPIIYEWVKTDCTQPQVTTDVSENIMKYVTKYPKMKQRGLLSLQALLNDDVFTITEKTKLHIAMQSCEKDGIAEETERVIDSIKHQVNGVFKLPTKTDQYMAYGHVCGAPIFGPNRGTLALAMTDRKALASGLDFLDKGSDKIQPVVDAVRSGAEKATTAGEAVTEKEKQDLLDDLF